ncbi:formate dehydrogenase accessory sulfurtransferase FdhD [Vibrio sp. TH_r3]|uniref:formate dehydrogenase accessory sulfurtransferase FdhD n=1 Tax=Vibrio sp. TH_r3 TaxID=3082084 RepID=UPI00295493D5|nr:formate dehydrogenase accessory sulfurtransferase FdhD [Vibrio sp. TH_r3]MDV7106282.1 formate dehydrogenase accessory sulfurtransferase FdhD [Vibrio sp. TH_r3]
MQSDKANQLETDKPVYFKQINRKRYVTDQGYHFSEDALTVEEPLQISIEWQIGGTTQCELWSMTMRTPGDDENLVYGLLIGQSVVSSWLDIEAIRCFDSHTSNAMNHIVVILKPGVEPRLSSSNRRSISTSSCGVCGATSIRALQFSQYREIDQSEHWLSPQDVLNYPSLLNQNQSQFHQTGSVHGAAYMVDGELIAVAEDIGRHNALDKLLGFVARQQIWHPQGVVVLTSRVSFELMQKAVISGIAAIVSVGAPSKIALDIARQFDMTLIGFTKAEQFNLYNGYWRMKPE